MPDLSVLPPSKHSLTTAYSPPKGVFDELIDADGTVRTPWRRLLRGLDALGIEEMRQRDELMQRLIRENGITYNVYQSNTSSLRPWMMDIVPSILAFREWRWIEKALRQRVCLFNKILGDIYGPQRLLKDGLLPVPLLFENPAFLRPCHGIRPPGDVFIHQYAADLARSPDGKWWVLSDRIEAPSGIGYALENRFITSHVMPEILRECGVMRLQPFFQNMRESFQNLVLRKTEEPGIVMLTPGAANESFYEQSFLARNLGYPMVEGADLTVRDHCVYLKTVAGMERVDVILRRVDSEFADPLELRGDSLLGVPGLVHAARKGNVVIANSLGSGFLQTPALSAFLPSLCQHMLGEELRMPSVATWWCGQPRECAYVLENIRKLVVKPVFRQRHGEAVFGQLADLATLEQLRTRIRQNPADWCAQEQVAQATTPVFDGQGLSPRHFLLRVFLVANGKDYSMMPGGLTRITSDLSSFSVSVQEGGQSQDTWMLTQGALPTPNIPLPNTGPVRLQRQTADLPSRAADNIYWFGRYLERTEQSLRLIRMLGDVMVQEAGDLDPVSVGPFLDFLLPEEVTRTLLPDLRETPLFPSRHKTIDVTMVESALARQIWDPTYSGSITQSLAAVHNTAFLIKERLSIDTWQALTRLREIETAASSHHHKNHRYNPRTLNEMLLSLASISGAISENTTRAYDWRFLELGRRIERAINAAGLLQNTLVLAPEDSRQLMNHLLVVADSGYTYRARYLTNTRLQPLLDLLILDESNPRSILYQVDHIRTHLAALPDPQQERPFSRIENLGLRIYTRLRLSDLPTLDSRDPEGRRTALDALLHNLMDDLANLSILLGQRFFAHGETGKLIQI